MKKIIWVWRVLMKVFCFGIFGFGSFSLGILVFPLIFLLVRSEEKKDRIMRDLIRWAFAAFTLLMRSLGLITVQWSGQLENLNSRKGRIIIANHPSLIDIVILMSRIRNADCIVKQSLFRFPLVRHVVGKLYISNELVDLALIDAGVRSLNSGKTLVIFPEGTRSGVSGTVSIKRGAARIALNSGCESIPVRIETQDATGLRKGDRMFTFRKDSAIDFSLIVESPITVADFQDLSPAIGARRLTEVYLQAISKKIKYQDNVITRGNMEVLVEEIKKLIIESLDLEDLEPDDIDPSAAIFGTGLGLDSIDALELGIAISKKYGVSLPEDKAENKKIFASVDALAAYISVKR